MTVGSKCELCSSTTHLSIYHLASHTGDDLEYSLLTCSYCLEQINGVEEIEVNHWRCLNETMWSEFSAVKVLSWRMLKRLSGEGWAQELLDQIYLDEDEMKWAEEGCESSEKNPPTKDSNGTILNAGDSVSLIKDLDVKGANFTAKRGTIVRKISLTDNPKHIEGRVNGTHIVLLTEFLKKVNG